MKLLFDKDLANNYKSKSQAIRVMSENWVANNLFCPCCGKNSLTHLKNNTPVSDFECNNCGEFFELKSKGKAIGRKINDGAYETMINRITSNTNPNLIVLEYNNLEVINVELIPKYFFTPEIIEKRKPLGLNAKRAGWIGCNIVYGNIPHQGRITIIKDGIFKDNNDITLEYTSTKKLQIESIIKRGWLFDVLICVNSLNKEIFTLEDMYKYENKLKKKHINNNNIRPKIRQQLQILRDKGYIEFLGNGLYRKKI